MADDIAFQKDSLDSVMAGGKELQRLTAEESVPDKVSQMTERYNRLMDTAQVSKDAVYCFKFQCMKYLFQKQLQL